MKSIKMTKDQYLKKHKELVELLGMDMIEKRIQAETDGLTVYQYGYIFALEKLITELENRLETSVSKIELDTCRALNEALRQRDDRMRKAMRNAGFVWSDDEFKEIK